MGLLGLKLWSSQLTSAILHLRTLWSADFCAVSAEKPQGHGGETQCCPWPTEPPYLLSTSEGSQINVSSL